MVEEKKKGFFSRLFSRSKEEVQLDIAITTKTDLNKMKKAELLDFGSKLDLELSESLTKVKIIEAILNHDADDKDTQLDQNETSKEEAPVEEVAQAEEAAPADEKESTSLDEQEIEEDDSKETKIAPKQNELNPSQIIEEFEKSQLKEDIPIFRPGDTVTVSVRVKEGERSRLQAFEGVVMHIKNAGLNSSFIVRKISSGIGVERTFQMHSPLIDSIAVKRKGDVRKAKLYYLRERSGRSARIKERLE